jgi:hypothetical protein
MADIRQAFVLTVQGDKAVLALADNVETAGKKTQNLTDRFAKASTTSSQFAGVMGQVTQQMARSAGVFGISEAGLRAVNDMAETAEHGLAGLTKTQVGWNTVTLAGAGAALSFGYAIGTWLRTFPQIAKFADDAVAGLVRLFTAQEQLDRQANAMRGLADFQKTMGESHEKARQKQIDYLKSVGKTTEEIKRYITTGTDRLTIDQKIEQQLDKQIAAEKKAEAALKQTIEKSVEAYKKQQQAVEDLDKALIDVTLAQIAYQKEIGDGAAEKKAAFNAEQLLKKLKDQETAYESMQDSMNEFYEMLDKHDFGKTTLERVTEAIDDAAGIIDEFGAALEQLGVSADSGLGRTVRGLSDLAHAAQDGAKAFAQFSSGDIAGGIMSSLRALGSAASGIKTLFFGGQQEHMKVNDLRDQFIEAQGGLASLGQKAAEVGLTLENLLRADRVTEFEAAVRQLTDAWDEQQRLLDLQAEAHRKTQEAVERYQFTIEELGPAMQRQKLDEMALQLIQDFKLLTASGIATETVLKRMAPSINEFVQASLAAGQAIPESMRSIIEQMIELRLLTDANGKAYEDLASTGITFTESLSEQFSKLLDKIDQLVNAMLGIPNVTRTVTINEQHVPGSGGDHEHGPPPKARGDILPFRPGGHVVRVAEGGDAELVAPVRAFAAEVARAAAAAGGGGGPMSIAINIDGHVLARVMAEYSRDGKLRIHPSAVTAAGF